MNDTLRAGYGWQNADAPHSCDYLGPKVLQVLHELKVQRVLDVGAGNGALCADMQAAGLSVVGMEIDPDGVAIASAKHPGVRFHCLGVDADPAVPLLSVLRDEQGLSGPKFGCGQGECGACMVLVDGQPQTACNLPLWAVEGRRVVTVEGLGTADQPHPVQTAFCEERAAQCGYCVAGIVTSAAALLARDPQPSRQAIVQALDKHLCRCGAHNRMIRAVERAAATLSSSPATP